MPRKRTLKPGYFTNEDLAGECSPLARLLFAGLWCWGDRLGRIQDRPRKIRVEILPYDEVDGDALLWELSDHGFIERYHAGGLDVIQVCEFDEHQDPHPREAASELPGPEQGSPRVRPRCGQGSPGEEPGNACPSRPSSSLEKQLLSGLASQAAEPASPAEPTAAQPTTAGAGEGTATGRAGKAPSLAKPTDPRFAPLRAAWEAEYEAVHREPYRWQGPADARGLHRVIAVPVEQFRERARRGLTAIGFLRCGTVAKLTGGEVWSQLTATVAPSAKPRRQMGEVSNWDDPLVATQTLADVGPK